MMNREELIKVIVIAIIAGAVFMGVRHFRSSDDNVTIQRKSKSSTTPNDTPSNTRTPLCSKQHMQCSKSQHCCPGMTCNQAPAYNGTGTCYKSNEPQPA